MSQTYGPPKLYTDHYHSSRPAYLWFLSEMGLVLGHNKFDNLIGTHEKKSREELIDFLYLKGVIVTLDAGGATTSICEKIKAKEADFVIGLNRQSG